MTDTTNVAYVDGAEWYWVNKPDLLEAAIMEFTPTSHHPTWQGKFRCMWCKSTGYLWSGCWDYRYWWGLRHGRECEKRSVE